MSLLDALLLEGHRDPREVWIALRSDGQKGSGTIDDPYDGGTRLGPALSATLTLNRKEFVVGLLNHGLSAGNSVAISGVQAPGDPVFNGTFTVQQVLSPSHFTLVLGSLPFAPPNVRYSYNPDIQATIPPGSTDPNNTRNVRLYWPVAKVAVPPNHGLTPLDGVNLSGASLPAGYEGDYPIFGPNGASGTAFAYRLKFLPGADVTTPISLTVKRLSHRFDEVMRSVPLNSVIHLGSGTFETRGFASLHVSHPTDFSQLYVGYIIREGQRLLGSGIGATTLKLVLPLDDLSQTTAVGNPSSPLANYAEVADLTVDCNVAGHVAPHGIFPAPVTCGAVGLGGSFIRVRRVRAINFCDQALPECFPIFLSHGAGGPAATFDVIEDCIVEKPGENNTHETTLISINGDVVPAGAISPIVRHNYHNCSYVMDDLSSVSSEHVAVFSIVQQNFPNHELFSLQTKRPHQRETTNNVLINGVTPLSHPLNRPFQVMQKVSDTEFVFKMPGAANPVATFDASKAYIGVSFYGRGAMGGTGCVTEGNAIFNCTSGLYTDTGSTRDVVVRDNYYSNISDGVNSNFDPVGAVEIPPRFARTGVNLATLTHNGTTANAHSAIPHGLVNGETVEISGARIGGSAAPAGTYNGNFAVTVVDQDDFTYTMATTPTANADAPDATFPILVGLFSLKRDVNNPKVAILQTAQPHQLRVGEADNRQRKQHDGRRANEKSVWFKQAFD